MKNPNDINIGKDEWITWIEGDSDEPVPIDHLLESTLSFWNRLEINCVVGCCGFDAFSFLPEDIIRAFTKAEKMKTKEELIRLKEIIQNIDALEVDGDIFGCYLHKSVFLQLLEHIIKTIESVPLHD
jgi:hypothetical protein